MATVLKTDHPKTAAPASGLKWIGTRPPRPDGVDKVTGRARFGADISLPGMLVGKVLRSPLPHARLKSIDIAKAAALPGVKAVEFTQRAHGLAHFLRATAGAGALLALLGRRAPEVRHLRRWLGPVIQELDMPRPLVAGWFAAGSAGCLFSSSEGEPTYRYIEAGMES